MDDDLVDELRHPMDDTDDEVDNPAADAQDDTIAEADPGEVEIPLISDNAGGDREPLYPGQPCLVLTFKGQSHEKVWRRASIDVVNEDGTCARPESARVRASALACAVPS